MSAYISTASDTAAGTFDRVQLASLSAQRRRLPFPKRAAVAILLRRAPPLPQPADAICRPRNSAAGIRDAGSASASCGGRCGGGDSSDGSRNECEERLEMLFILRDKNERDRWSGQVGFPGGRMQRSDGGSEMRTVQREVEEELGIVIGERQSQNQNQNSHQPKQGQRQHESSAPPPLFRYLFSLDDYYVGPLTLRDSPLSICTLVFMQTCAETPPLTLAPKEIAAHCWVPLDFFIGGPAPSPTASAWPSLPGVTSRHENLISSVRQRFRGGAAEELPRILDVDATRTTNFPAWIGALGPWPGLALPVALGSDAAAKSDGVSETNRVVNSAGVFPAAATRTGGVGIDGNMTATRTSNVAADDSARVGATVAAAADTAAVTDARFFLWGLTLSLTAACLARLGHPRLHERLSAPRYLRAPQAFRFVTRTRIALLVQANRWQQKWQQKWQAHGQRVAPPAAAIAAKL